MNHSLSKQLASFDSGWMKFVEVKTKTTTTMVFLLCLSLSWFLGWPIRWAETLCFFAAVLIVDLATTSVNNYMGYRKEGEQLSVQPRTGRIIIFSLFITSILLGILLVFMTQNLLILLFGIFSFMVGATYTTGPLPISGTPLGELLSGFIQGYVNMLIYALINVPAGRFMQLSYESNQILFTAELTALMAFLLIGWIPTALIANVMLSNNICDLQKDEGIGRYTLPHYLGYQKSLTLYQGLYYSIYLVIIALAAMRVFSIWHLLMLLTFPFVQRNIRLFKGKQDKATTFPLTLANLLVIILTLTLLLSLLALLTPSPV